MSKSWTTYLELIIKRSSECYRRQPSSTRRVTSLIQISAGLIFNSDLLSSRIKNVLTFTSALSAFDYLLFILWLMILLNIISFFFSWWFGENRQLGAEHAIRMNSGLNRVRAQSWFGPCGPSAGSLILTRSCDSDLLDPFPRSRFSRYDSFRIDHLNSII